jgi:anti-sigma B factor antagonist
MSASPVAGPSAGSAAQVTDTVVGRRTVLSVAGEIDLASAPLVADAVDEALKGGALELWLDLSSTEFMDSTGLHLLMETQTRLDSLSRRLALICPRGPVRRVLELAGMAERLPLYDDRAAAHHAA